MTTQILACRRVSMGYGRQLVLPEVSLEIHAGEILGILGPNGAGKSTLLKTLLGIIAPLHGEVAFPAGRAAVRFGYVPQRQVVDETYPLTVAEVVLMGRYGLLAPGKRPGRADRDAVQTALDDVGMAAHADRRYRDLSGGQKQRVLLARALVGNPSVLVLDEPTTDMDLGSERAIMELIPQLHRARGLTTLVVSHLLHVVLNVATRVALVDREVRVVTAEDARTGACLSAFYGLPVRVAQVDGLFVAL